MNLSKWLKNMVGHPVAFLLIFFSLLHAGLFCFDLANPDSFSRGDRSFDRLGKTTYLYEGRVEDSWFDKPATLIQPTPAWPDRMVENGAPGDYIVAGSLYRFLGHAPTVFIQILLTLGAIVMVFLLGREMGLSRGYAVAGATLFGLLPGPLVQAHMIVSEAWFMPTLALASWGMVRLFQRGPSPALITLTVVAWTLTIFFRQQFLLLPIALTLLTAWHFRHSKRWLCAPLLLLAMAPNLMWSATENAITANWQNESASFTDIGFQLHQRLLRMNAAGDLELEDKLADTTRVSPVTFFQLTAKYPKAYLRTALSDNADFFLNPGTAYFSRYLDLLPDKHKNRGWGAIRDEKGLLGMVVFLVVSSPVFAAFMVTHAGVHLLMLALGLLGLVVWLRKPPSGIYYATRWFVLGCIIYTYLIIQLSYQSRWSLRQPVEILFAPLAIFGWLQCQIWWQNHKRCKMGPQARHVTHAPNN